MSKQALKAAKTCINSEDWIGAEAQARKALSFEPQNYFAHLFLGLSLFNLEKYEESEAAYQQAIQIEADERQKKDRKETPAAWQGLLKLYEAQKRVGEYVDSAVRLSSIFREQAERLKSLEVIEKAVSLAQENGSKSQYKRALHILLPGSPIFDYLDGLIPRADQTYLKLAELIESEEKEKINKEIANRRSRLGAVLGQVTTEVRREVWGSSQLEELYQNILNWSDDEELRRQIDCKLLQHAYNKLLVFPKENKLEQRVKVENWARGLVILKYPFELAWRIVIEWKDCETLVDHDVNLLREYIEFFPDSGLAISLRAYLDSEICPFPTVPDADNAKGAQEIESSIHGTEETTDQRLDSMIDGTERSPTSVLCHRILAEYYLLLDEYENAVDVSRAGLKLLTAESQRTGLSCQKNTDALIVTLATALIQYQAPKHHNEARTFFENVLKHNPSYGSALVGLGLILEEQCDYAGAVDLLNKALAKDPGNIRILAEAAWCNVLAGNHSIGQQGLEECLEKITGVDARSRDLKAQIIWRIGTSLWNADEEGRRDRKAGPYHYFIAALQNNQNFAPAYTSLGCFYADVAADTARANKCFQRAFELSAGEVQAAERLARSFAETKEWELVEIVARRVAEVDKKRSVPGKGISWPQSAIGVVELNNQNYSLAIQAFQSALRASPDDFHSWIGLGEAYASSGRYTAALKVFTRAEALDEKNWFAKYMLANVRRELGEYELACEGYRAVLSLREREFGVLVALSETLMAMAWKYIETGYYGRAVDSILECVAVMEKVLQERTDAFNLWKTLGDACMLFSWVQRLADKFPRSAVLHLLESDLDPSEFDIMMEVDEVGRSTFERMKSGDFDQITASTYAGILAYKRAIFATADDRHAHAVAWYNLGTAEYRAYTSLSRSEMKNRLAAIRCFKRTIKLEPGNHEFWNALGLATAELNPKVAQHSLVRALYINEKNARVWTNLGTLYTIQEDYMLANEAFSRAQSTDPEYALAWVGQGIIATILGESREAQELFQHAFEISDQSLVPTKKQFITATFDTLVKARSEPALTSIVTLIFALEKLETQLSEMPLVLQLSALLDERVQDFESAIHKLERVCSIYEQNYEETESDDDLIKFAQSKADLSRMHLGLNNYAEAIECASMALILSGDNQALQTCRLSAHLTSGLAHYYSHQMDDSLEMFKAALSESEENPDVVCLLSQVLWAKGSEEERDVARDQLFAAIEANPDHLGSILLLGTIGVLDKSEDVAEAVLDDLRSFRVKEGLPREVKEKIDNLLTAIAQLSSGENSGVEAVATAATAVFTRPAATENWSRLATVAGDVFAAETALRVAQRAKDCDSERLAKAYAGIATVGCDLRAIFLAPWLAEGWDALARDVMV
ncbi:hypothetical protein FN846DRAFT_941480 [Sphaerosporella brunnea]|uniref:TPR-like protein n=1 Tax=Sphaerosporella brunnea TaxID=1250544 RepID=A0A5J5F1U7_9PEZI|nr:hypothetical protein FN846DRAFT_941480 [Sphaerosporella brunnea]